MRNLSQSTLKSARYQQFITDSINANGNSGTVTMNSNHEFSKDKLELTSLISNTNTSTSTNTNVNNNVRLDVNDSSATKMIAGVLLPYKTYSTNDSMRKGKYLHNNLLVTTQSGCYYCMIETTSVETFASIKDYIINKYNYDTQIKQYHRIYTSGNYRLDQRSDTMIDMCYSHYAYNNKTNTYIICFKISKRGIKSIELAITNILTDTLLGKKYIANQESSTFKLKVNV